MRVAGIGRTGMHDVIFGVSIPDAVTDRSPRTRASEWTSNERLMFDGKRDAAFPKKIRTGSMNSVFEICFADFD